MSYRNADGLRPVVWAVALLSFVHGVASAAVPAARPKFSVPVVFEPGPGPTPRFLARASGYRVLLDEKGAAITSGRAGREIRLRFVGSRRAAPVAEGQLPGTSNYFVGADPSRWRTNVPHFSGVRYYQLYKGVDAIFYAVQGRVEFDLELRAGVAPESIGIVYGGATNVRIEANGDLHIDAGGEPLVQRKPRAFQQTADGRSEVDVRYELRGRTLSLVPGRYDRTRPLVIDPVLEWGTFIGGSRDDVAGQIATDATGNVYLTGSTQSTDFPVARGFQMASRGGQDIFVTKLNATGTAILYSTYLGGSGTDDGTSIAVDSSNNAWVTGSTTSRDFPTRNPSQASLTGTENAIVAKLNDAGTDLLMSTYLGGSGTDVGQSIALNSLGAAVVTGKTTSTDLSGVSADSFQQRNAGGQDAFIARYGAQGAREAVTYYGGTRDDIAYAATFGSGGDIYITGESMSPRLPGVDDSRFQVLNRASGFSAFVLRMDATVKRVAYATFLGGSMDQAGFAIAVDSNGAAYVGGVTNSSDFPISNNALQRVYRGAADGFVTILQPAGNAIAGSTFVGGSGLDFITAIRLDSARRIYVAGYTGSLDIFPTLPRPAKAGQTFVAQLSSPADQARFATFLDATDNTLSVGLAIRLQAGGDSIYVAGTASSSFRFPSMRGSQLRPQAGGNDAFVARLANADVQIRNREQSGTNFVAPTSGGVRDATAAPGGNSDLLFEVTNNGPSDAEGVEVVVSLPQGVSPVRCSSISGRCTTDATTARVFYNLLPVSVRDNVTVTVRSGVGQSQGTNFTVQARVSSATNDPETDNNQASANFSVIGVIPFTVNPVATLDFGNVAVGAATSADLIVRPNNAVNISLLFASATGPANPAFSFAQAQSFPLTVSQERRFPITFRPVAAGQSTGQIDVRDVDLGYVYTVDLNATGTAPSNDPSVIQVTEAAGFRPMISANAWVAIKGTNLATTTRPWGGSDFAGTSLPRNLEGTSVTINGRPAYVSYISPTQVNVLAPVGDTTTGVVPVVVTTPSGTVTTTVNKQAISPGLFLFDGAQVAAVFIDGSLVARAGTFPAPLQNTRGARPGEAISLFLGGLGPTVPSAPEGVIPPSASNLASAATVQIGNAPATVTFRGMSVLPGLYQFNIVVPPSLTAGDYPVVVTTAGQSTQPSATLRVQP